MLTALLGLFLAGVGARTVEEWRAIVRENAEANPLAQFDEADLIGFASFSATEPAAPEPPRAANTDPAAAPAGLSGAEIAGLLDPLGEHPAVDWRAKGAVTPVKNQGAFGTCWSFAVAENLEGLNFRQGNTLQNISSQELIDCCKQCQGRSEDITFEYMLNNTAGRLDTQESYPYAGPSTACKAKDGVESSVKLHSFGRQHDDGTGKPIVAALLKYGPMGLGVDASCFAGYKGGIITNCSKAAIDHAVLMVAAGTDTSLGNTDYYTIKNSWGGKWGEHGYVRVQRGSPAQCGIGSTMWSL